MGEITRWVILIVFMGGWEISARSGWIDPFLFSSPLRVWNLFFEMLTDGDLFDDIGVTILETVIGFILGHRCRYGSSHVDLGLSLSFSGIGPLPGGFE